MFVALKLLANIATKILLAVLWADGNNFRVISVCFDWGDYGGGGSGGVGDGESDGDSRDEGNGGQCVVGNGGDGGQQASDGDDLWYGVQCACKTWLTWVLKMVS